MTTTAPAPVSAAVIRRALGEFALPAYDEQVLQIQQYMKILLAWNEKIILTAIRDPLEILYRHFCESMSLKIMRPGLRVFLVESNIKKVTFLAEVIRELGLRDAQVLARRYEELGEEVAPLDYVCSRALGEFPAFLEWARSEQIAAKQVILWIGARDLPEIQKVASWSWREPIQVPHSLRRLLLVGTKRAPDVTVAT